MEIASACVSTVATHCVSITTSPEPAASFVHPERFFDITFRRSNSNPHGPSNPSITHQGSTHLMKHVWTSLRSSFHQIIHLFIGNFASVYRLEGSLYTTLRNMFLEGRRRSVIVERQVAITSGKTYPK